MIEIKHNKAAIKNKKFWNDLDKKIGKDKANAILWETYFYHTDRNNLNSICEMLEERYCND